MRPDLVRLLVDNRRKDLITHADGNSIVPTKTIDRVGLSKPLVPHKGEKSSVHGPTGSDSNGEFVEVKH